MRLGYRLWDKFSGLEFIDTLRIVHGPWPDSNGLGRTNEENSKWHGKVWCEFVSWGLRGWVRLLVPKCDPLLHPSPQSLRSNPSRCRVETLEPTNETEKHESKRADIFPELLGVERSNDFPNWVYYVCFKNRDPTIRIENTKYKSNTKGVVLETTREGETSVDPVKNTQRNTNWHNDRPLIRMVNLWSHDSCRGNFRQGLPMVCSPPFSSRGVVDTHVTPPPKDTPSLVSPFPVWLSENVGRSNDTVDENVTYGSTRRSWSKDYYVTVNI